MTDKRKARSAHERFTRYMLVVVRMLLTRMNTMMKATLLTQPRHSIHGIMTVTTNAPALSYTNLLTSVELRNTKSLSPELPLPHSVHGAAVIRKSSAAEVIVAISVRLDPMLRRAVILLTVFISTAPKFHAGPPTAPSFHNQATFTICESENIHPITISSRAFFIFAVSWSFPMVFKYAKITSSITRTGICCDLHESADVYVSETV